MIENHDLKYKVSHADVIKLKRAIDTALAVGEIRFETCILARDAKLRLEAAASLLESLLKEGK